MKILLIGIIASFITSCETRTRDKQIEDEMYCIDGVEYINIWRKMAPHFKPDGTLYTCEAEQ